MPNKHYIDAKQFSDFKSNQETLIGILNHSMSEMREDVKCVTKDISKIAEHVCEMKGKFNVTSKVVWWIMGGFIALVTVIAAGILAS